MPKVEYEDEPKAVLTYFVKTIGEGLTNPRIRRYLKKESPKKPWIPYAILNVLE